jgi:transposase
MAEDDEDDSNGLDAEFPEPRRRRDRKVDDAKEVLLLELFSAEPEGVFYERQISSVRATLLSLDY